MFSEAASSGNVFLRKVDEAGVRTNGISSQSFRDRASAKSQSLFPTKPFWVIAEDSNRRFVTTCNDPDNPNGRKVVDAIWNFGYRYEIRRLETGQTLFQARPLKTLERFRGWRSVCRSGEPSRTAVPLGSRHLPLPHQPRKRSNPQVLAVNVKRDKTYKVSEILLTT